MKIAQAFRSSAVLSTALVCLLAAACASTKGSDTTASSGDPKSQAAEAKKKARQAKELETARMELSIAEMSATEKQRQAEEGVRSAQVGLAEAQKELDLYKGVEGPIEIEAAKIDLDQASFRVAMQEAELKELEDMYKQEQFATTTKELVLERGKKEVEFAKREYAVAEKKHTNLETVEVPKKTRELDEELRKAQEELRKANEEAKKTQAENQLELHKARRKIEKLEQGDDEEKGE